MTYSKDQIKDQFMGNMGRVMSILALHGVHARGDAGLPPNDWADLLRAAVMLLHATLEDLLRSLAGWKLPLATAKALDRIPFASENSKETITLAALTEFRGRSVDRVIEEAVTRHLETKSYNNIEDVVRSLGSIDLGKSSLTREMKSDLDTMMKRRHLIAHRADRGPPNESGARPVESISARSVYRWAHAVRSLGLSVLNEVDGIPGVPYRPLAVSDPV